MLPCIVPYRYGQPLQPSRLFLNLQYELPLRKQQLYQPIRKHRIDYICYHQRLQQFRLFFNPTVCACPAETIGAATMSSSAGTAILTIGMICDSKMNVNKTKVIFFIYFRSADHSFLKQQGRRRGILRYYKYAKATPFVFCRHFTRVMSYSSVIATLTAVSSSNK